MRELLGGAIYPVQPEAPRAVVGASNAEVRDAATHLGTGLGMPIERGPQQAALTAEAVMPEPVVTQN